MKVLLPVDGSEAAERAVQFVAACAPGRFTPTLVNVQRAPIRAWPAPEMDWEGVSRALRAPGEQLVARHVEALSRAGHRAESKVYVGSAASTILEVVQELAPSLLVMGTRGAGLLGGFALGSVALRVAPAAPCPVILVKPDARLPAAGRSATRVLAPLDGSAVSEAAIARLLTLRELLGPLHVDLVHFEPGLTFVETIAPPHDDVLRSWGGEATRRAVAGALQQLREAGVPHEVVQAQGEPATGIAALAAERGCDLIAMASHGAGALRHATFGSVALKTAVLAGVPVMLTN